MPDTNVASDLGRIAQDLQIRKVQVESVVQLLDEGNTVPFITRYRKERTGGLNEDVIRQIQARVEQPARPGRAQADHPQEHRGPGQADRRAAGRHPAPPTPQAARRPLPALQAEEEDAGQRRRASKGLEPLALAIWNRDPAVANLAELLPDAGQPREGAEHAGGRAARACSTSWPR